MDTRLDDRRGPPGDSADSGGGAAGDSELRERLLRGDEEAFRILVARYHPRIFKLVRGILNDWHQSEDVCQEVFTTVFRRLGSFRQDASIATWIYRVAVNAALKARKRLRRLPVGGLSEEVMSSSQLPSRGPVSAAEDLDPSLRLAEDESFRKLLAPLPENLRVPVVLKEAGGLSYDEIAGVLGCSRGAVEQRLHRAMVQLRKVWKESHERFQDRT
jgi:RNA polymerase sigma factor (sigma-70 family)